MPCSACRPSSWKACPSACSPARAFSKVSWRRRRVREDLRKACSFFPVRRSERWRDSSLVRAQMLCQPFHLRRVGVVWITREKQCGPPRGFGSVALRGYRLQRHHIGVGGQARRRGSPGDSARPTKPPRRSRRPHWRSAPRRFGIPPRPGSNRRPSDRWDLGERGRGPGLHVSDGWQERRTAPSESKWGQRPGQLRPNAWRARQERSSAQSVFGRRSRGRASLAPRPGS